MLASLIRSWRRLRHGKPIVVVSGLPRSGTSMAMKMLAAGGVPIVTDGERTADEDNPKGYFEDERIKDLARMDDKGWLRASRGKAIKVISHLLKELPADNNYQVLFIRRDMSEILASQAKMLVRRGESSATDDAKMTDLFEADLWRARYLLKRGGHFEWIELHYGDFHSDPAGQAARIRSFLGRDMDTAGMAEVVDPSLWRNRGDETPAADAGSGQPA